MTRNLREVIAEINFSSEQVSSSSEELTAVSEEVSASIEEVTKSINEVALGASNQARNTEEGTKKAYQLGRVFQENTIALNELMVSTKKVNNVVEYGLNDINILYEANQVSNMSHKEIKEVILKTNESAQKISEASEMIENIADQTIYFLLMQLLKRQGLERQEKDLQLLLVKLKVSTAISETVNEIADIVKELQSNSEDAVVQLKSYQKLKNVRTKVLRTTKNNT